MFEGAVSRWEGAGCVLGTQHQTEQTWALRGPLSADESAAPFPFFEGLGLQAYGFQCQEPLLPRTQARKRSHGGNILSYFTVLQVGHTL